MVRIPGTVLQLALGLLISACERAAPPPPSDSTRAATADTVLASSDTVGPVGWQSEAGPFLAIPDDSLRTAMIVAGVDDSVNADTSGITDTVSIDVFTTAGKTGNALLAPYRPARSSDVCRAWPSARIRRIGGGRPARRWNVGLASGRVLPLAMDSLAGLSRTDSARLVSDIARLASTAPNDTSLAFRGLPFRVHTAYRTQISASETVFVATVIRNVNQEADARAEHLLLVGERPKSQGAKPVLHYVERSSGPEETLETAEVLATVLVGIERTPTIIIGRSDDAGVAFSILERGEGVSWTLRWTSSFNDC